MVRIASFGVLLCSALVACESLPAEPKSEVASSSDSSFPRHPAYLKGAPDWGLTKTEMTAFVEEGLSTLHFTNLDSWSCKARHGHLPNCYAVSLSGDSSFPGTRMNIDFKFQLLKSLRGEGFVRINDIEIHRPSSGVAYITINDDRPMSNDEAAVFVREENGFALKLFRSLRVSERTAVPDIGAMLAQVPIDVKTAPKNKFASKLLLKQKNFDGLLCYYQRTPGHQPPTPLQDLQIGQTAVIGCSSLGPGSS